MPPKGKRKGTNGAKKALKASSECLSSAKQQPPDWPPFHPLIPSSDLSFQVLIPEQIVLIPNFWTSTLCKTYVNFLSSLPLVTTPSRVRKDEAVRVNDRFQIEDAAFAQKMWHSTALETLIMGTGPGVNDGKIKGERQQLWDGDVVGLNPNIRIYKYSKGQFFAPHYDDSNTFSLPTQPPTPVKTTWTLLLYLTSPATGCIGGETVFYPENAVSKKPPATPSSKKAGASNNVKSNNLTATDPVVVGLEVGMALLHKHGNECMLHEGREVVEGEKWVIRSDLCVLR